MPCGTCTLAPGDGLAPERGVGAARAGLAELASRPAATGVTAAMASAAVIRRDLAFRGNGKDSPSAVACRQARSPAGAYRNAAVTSAWRHQVPDHLLTVNNWTWSQAGSTR